MAIRRAAALFSALALATACTAVLGVEDVPDAPADGGGGVPSADVVTTPETGGGGDVLEAIDKYATAYCQKFLGCVPAQFNFLYTGVAECAASLGSVANLSVGLPGMIATATDFQGCEARISSLSCDTFLSSDSGFACSLKGTRKLNDRCISNYQCESGLCGTELKVCRGCINPPENGQPCAQNALCGPGLRCNGLGICVTEAKRDEPCGDDKPCVFGLVCSGGACRQPPTTEGASCVPEIGCDANRGLICLGGACVQAIFVYTGEPCGYGGNPGERPRICYRDSACNGQCNPPPSKAGDACGQGFGSCLLPLVCDNGICVAPPPSSFCE